MSLPGQLLGAMKSVSTPAGGSHNLFSGVSLRHRGRARKLGSGGGGGTSDADKDKDAGVSARPAEASPEPRPRRGSKVPVPLRSPPSLAQAHARSLPSLDTPEQRGDTPLDTVSKNAAPHIAVRYGDVVRLYAKSKYVGADDAGGYVGSFELEKRFLASKNPAKQVELVCVPPILGAGAAAYRPASFTVLSNCGLGVGTPVSYGDVIVLVDESGRVWNNKMGLGPSTKHGYLSPREPNTPGEMYVSFYQLQDDDDDDSRSSESSDEEDNFVFFSNLAKTTRTVAETTFGKPTQAEVNLANAALRTMGKVVYYGDRNVVINVADSNRVRSKFNRVITHYSKSEQHAVRGGFLRCDGRGKPILFELHGADLPSVTSIDMSARAGFRLNASTAMGTAQPTVIPGVPLDVGHSSGIRSTGRALKSMMLPTKVHASEIAVGQPVLFTAVQRSMVITVRLSDGGCVILPCERLAKNEGSPISRAIVSGRRPLRVTMRASRPTRGAIPRSVNLRSTLRGTYRQIAKLSCVVIVAYVCAAYACSHVFGSVVALPALYVGLIAGGIVFIVEAFLPGKIVAVRQIRPSEGEDEVDGDEASSSSKSDNEDTMGDWQLVVLSVEASESERREAEELTSKAQAGSGQRRSLKVPKSFLAAEHGDLAQAMIRYELTLAWRREVQADAVLNTPQTFYDAIKSNYIQYLHKHDRFGHPVYFEKIGKINIKQLQKSGITQDDLFRHYLFAMEFTIKYAAHECCQCPACASSDTQKLCLVLDTRGLGMRDMGGESFEFIRRCTGVMQRHYPQRSFKIFFVNVPSWFGMAWKGVKPLLNEATRAKTSIVTESDTLAALLEWIDAENLPEEYGGTCSCPGGCEHNSTYQRLQRKLVESVKDSTPLDATELLEAIADERAQSRGENPKPRARGVDPASVWTPTPVPPAKESAFTRLKRFNSSPAQMDVEGSSDSSPPPTQQEYEMLDTTNDTCGGFLRSIPAGLFRDEVLRAGYLLKRSLRHKQFNPIWHRQLFILHADSLRFAKTLDSEIFQIVSLTSDTAVRRTQKQNNSFEVITPPMAANGHSLLLYAPTRQVMHAWVDALTDVIERLGGPSSTTSSTASGSTTATTTTTTAAAVATVAAAASAAGIAAGAHSASEFSRSRSPENSTHSHEPSPPPSSSGSAGH